MRKTNKDTLDNQKCHNHFVYIIPVSHLHLTTIPKCYLLVVPVLDLSVLNNIYVAPLNIVCVCSKKCAVCANCLAMDAEHGRSVHTQNRG